MDAVSGDHTHNTSAIVVRVAGGILAAVVAEPELHNIALHEQMAIGVMGIIMKGSRKAADRIVHTGGIKPVYPVVTDGNPGIFYLIMAAGIGVCTIQ